jgi:2'-5' RNA ligase
MRLALEMTNVLVMFQFMFPAQPARLGSKTNLFLAFLPPPDMWPVITGLCRVLQRAHGLHGHVMRGDRLHVTLAGVADPLRTREKMIADVVAIAGSVRRAAVSLRFDQTQSFSSGNRYPLVLGGGRPAPAREFRHMLAGRLRRAGIAVDRSFTPHVTMLWADRRVGDHPIAPIEWTADELVLVESGHGRHVHLARWALG